MPGTIYIVTVVPPGFIFLLYTQQKLIPAFKNRFARQKSTPESYSFVIRQQVSDSSLNKIQKNLNYDDNGITGPDWGHSELVFNCFRKRCSQHTNVSTFAASLSDTFHSLLVSSTCYFIFSNCNPKKLFCKVVFSTRLPIWGNN